MVKHEESNVMPITLVTLIMLLLYLKPDNSEKTYLISSILSYLYSQQNVFKTIEIQRFSSVANNQVNYNNEITMIIIQTLESFKPKKANVM